MFYLDSDVWAGCFTIIIIFAGSFHYFKPVSWWILFCENVTDCPWPFDSLPSHVGKAHMFKTPEMRLYFDSDVPGGCLTIIFVGSFPYFKFLTKINSKVRRRKPAKDWPVAGCFGQLLALIYSTEFIICQFRNMLVHVFPRGGTRDFKWQGWPKDFFGFEIFDFGIFLGTKIWQVFFWVAWFE